MGHDLTFGTTAFAKVGMGRAAESWSPGEVPAGARPDGRATTGPGRRVTRSATPTSSTAARAAGWVRWASAPEVGRAAATTEAGADTGPWCDQDSAGRRLAAGDPRGRGP